MTEIQYYAAIDPDAPAACCWYKADCPEEVFFTKNQQGIYSSLLRFDGQMTDGVEIALNHLSRDIFCRYGGDKESLSSDLCIAVIIPYKTSEECRRSVRKLLAEKGVSRIRFITKEAAAVLYVCRKRRFETLDDGTYLLLDAGETQASASVIQVQNKAIRILEHTVKKGAGAKALDSAWLSYLIELFGTVFRGFCTEHGMFQKLLTGWLNSRITMEKEAPVELVMTDFLSYARHHLPLAQFRKVEAVISEGYVRKLSLFADDIRQFGEAAFDEIWKIFYDMLCIAERLQIAPEKLQVIVNGGYLNMPPLRSYLQDRQKDEEWMMVRKLPPLMSDRAACLQGALAVFDKIEGLSFTGALKRTWGIVTIDKEEKQYFKVLIPGGQKLTVGYEANFFVSPARADNAWIDINLCSAPAWWHWGNDIQLLSCEHNLRISTPKTVFPGRKLRVCVKITDILLVSVHDLTSGNREEWSADIDWEQAPDLIIES